MMQALEPSAMMGKVSGMDSSLMRTVILFPLSNIEFLLLEVIHLYS